MNRMENLFPKEIRTLDDLPPLVGGFVRQLPAESTRRLVTIPAGAYPVRRMIGRRELPLGWCKTPFRTLVLGTDELVVIEVDEQDLSTVVIPFVKLLRIHLFQVLSYSFVEFSWMADDRIQTIQIEYNLVGDVIMSRCIEQIRATFPPQRSAGPQSSPVTDLSFLPFKFMNYLRLSLMPGETLRTVVCQPAVHSPLSRLKPTSNYTVALTDRTLIMIEDGLQFNMAADSDYAVIRYLYPLCQIKSLTIESGLELDGLHLQLGQGHARLETAITLTHSDAEALYRAFYAQAASAPV